MGYLLRLVSLVVVVSTALVLHELGRAARLRDDYRAQLTQLLEAGTLPPRAPAGGLASDEQAARGRLLGLLSRFAGAAPVTRSVHEPFHADRALAQTREHAASHRAELEELAALLAEPAVARVLAAGRDLGVTFDVDRDGGSGRLDRLCMAAAVDAALAGDDAGSARWVARALDLLALGAVDDARTFVARAEAQERWLGRLRALVGELGVDARALFEALDARLARAAAGEPAARTLVAQFAHDKDEGYEPRAPGGDGLLGRRAWERAAAQLEALARAQRAARLPPDHPDQPARDRVGRLLVPHAAAGAPERELVTIEHTARRLQRELTLGRVALALAAERADSGAWPATLAALAPRFGGRVPGDPLSGRPFPLAPRGELVLEPLPGLEPASGALAGWVWEPADH